MDTERLPARSRDPQPHNSKDLSSANSLNELESRFASRAPERNRILLTPRFWPWEALGRGPTRPTRSVGVAIGHRSAGT